MGQDYLLGHHEAEWRRLEDQHALWRECLLQDLLAAGLTDGSRVIDVGCGIGSLTADLEAIVGRSGRVIGLERDAEAAEVAKERFASNHRVTILRGDLLNAAIPGTFDIVVCRWVLSFVPELDRAIERLAGLVAPGGALVVQDYDHDGVNLFPRVDGFAEVIEAFRAAYRDSGGDLWVATKLPRSYQAQGLTDIAIHPHSKASGPGGGAWSWVARFLREHLDEVVASGHLDQAVAVRFTEALRTAESDPGAVLVTPMVMSVVGRRAQSPG